MNFDKFDALINDAYNYEECLERQGLKQEDVELLREKMKRSKLVPRFIHDKQVRKLIRPLLNLITLISEASRSQGPRVRPPIQTGRKLKQVPDFVPISSGWKLEQTPFPCVDRRISKSPIQPNPEFQVQG